MSNVKFGEISEIKNDEDLEVARCALAAIDESLKDDFLLDNILISTRSRDYSVSVTLDIPAEYYHEYLLSSSYEKFGYEHLRKLCDHAKTHENLRKTGRLVAAYEERDRLMWMMFEYEKSKQNLSENETPYNKEETRSDNGLNK